MLTRRTLLGSTVALAALATVGSPARAASYVPVETPNGRSLPWKMVNGVKQFHLVAEPVKREFAPGMVVDCWGYNGLTPGPTIEAVEGDRVRILVTNKLPEPTSVHWHGIYLPNGMDGVSGLTQGPIRPGDTFKYEFTLRQHGTFMYHPHADEMTQMALGMMGFFIVHPKAPRGPMAHRDFCIFLAEWFIEPGTSRPNPMVMLDFNTFTFNSRAYPGTAPLVVKTGQRVRLRLANLSMDSHPIHIHGYSFQQVATDGGEIPPSARFPETTVNVPVGSTRTVEFLADVPGDWPLHCHKTHHAMNAMGHDIPNMLDVSQSGIQGSIEELIPDYMPMGETGMYEMAEMNMPLPPNTLKMGGTPGPYGPIDMGGMFTVVKVRDHLPQGYRDPGWYRQPPGTRALPVGKPAPPPPKHHH